jgi:hypothetical protein
MYIHISYNNASNRNIFSPVQLYYEDQWLDLDNPSLVSLEIHSKQLLHSKQIQQLLIEDQWLDLDNPSLISLELQQLLIKVEKQ